MDVKPPSSSSKLLVDTNLQVVHDDVNNKDVKIVTNNQNLNNNNNTHSIGDDNVFDDPFVNFPPGLRFCPYDDELIVHYLKKKVMNQKLPLNKIRDVELYKYTPEELSGNYPTLGGKEWYFFTPRDRKYRNGNRPNRAAGSGYWKATGADKPIKHIHEGLVGYRKALVFYEGKPPKGKKTDWIMHEFRVKEAPPPKTRAGVNDMRLDDWVLCRIYKKVDKSSVKCTPKNNDGFDYRQPTPPPPPHHNNDEHLSSTKDESNIITNVQFSSLLLHNKMVSPYHYPYNLEFGNKFNGTSNVSQRYGYQDPPIFAQAAGLTFQESLYNHVDDYASYILPTDPSPNIDEVMNESADYYSAN